MSQSSPGGSETEKRKKDSQEEWLSLEDAEKGAKPGSAHDAFRSLLPCKVTVKCLMCSVLLVALILSLVVALAVVASRRYTPSCPDSWVGYQRKCYYFSETEGNWDFSRSQCLALGTSVTGIDSLQELTFLKRHKGPNSHWIGLRKEGEGQPWKWVNGTEFNKLFNVTEGADCAYMDSIQVSSSSCLTTKKWICSKPSVH
ncbi:C-type lectin domain family 2 member B-like [Pelodiscus sinensis]|uniref:C-type lectin domain family 2 member B-like n=1 Tax=Pelodiscus sinensis TaxID=13735 RepID=UPI003F6A7EBA